MQTNTRRFSEIFLICAATIVVAGCSTPPPSNQGTTNQVPTDVRGPNPDGRLGSKELENTTDEMLASIVSRLGELHTDENGWTVIVADRLDNRSAYPEQEFDIFMAQLRVKLNNSGARYQIRFVENPRQMEAVRDRVLEDDLKDDYETPGLRPHYVLHGNAYAMDEGASRYWEVFFQLTDLDPNSPYRNMIVWEDSSGYRFARY